jgi:predicted nucleic acid-binding Zn ribbon protein
VAEPAAYASRGPVTNEAPAPWRTAADRCDYSMESGARESCVSRMNKRSQQNEKRRPRLAPLYVVTALDVIVVALWLPFFR